MATKYYAEINKQRRLNNSICFYDGKPVYVITRAGWNGSALGEEEVYIAPLPQSGNIYEPTSWKKIKYTEDAFSYDAFPLGYLNFKRDAYYTYRIPSQHQTQGLDRGNFASTANNLALSVMHTQAMEDCILGKYPSFAEALEQVQSKKAIGVGFDRNFAVVSLGGNLFIQHSGISIGIWSKKSKCFALFPSGTNRILSNELNTMGVTNVVISC